MAITLGEAVLWIRGKSDKLKTDLDQSGKQVEGWANRIKGQLSESMNYAVGQIMSQGINQLAAGIENMARETINLGMEYAQQVEDMSRLSGASVEDTSRIIQVADDMRLSYDGISTALKMYAKAQADSGQGSKMSIETLARLSDQYLALAPGVDRANFLLQNFGKSGIEMGKLMEQGGDGIRSMAAAVDESMIMTEEGIRASEEYRLAMDEWNDAIAGIKLKLWDELAPYLTRFAQWMVDEGIPALEKFIIWFTKLPEPVKGATFALGGLLVAAVQLGPAIMGIAGILGLFKGSAAAAGTAAAAGAAKTGLLATAFGGLKAALVGIGGFLAGITLPVWALIAAIVALIATIAIFGKDAWNTIMMIAQIWNAVLGRIRALVYAFIFDIVHTFRGAYNQAREAGANLVDGIWAGIQVAFERLKTNVKTALDNLLAWVRDAIQASSPSKLWADMVGNPMALGIGAGFEQAISGEVRHTIAAGTGALAAAAGQAAQVSVGRVEIHGRLSQSEVDFIDRRSERISENALTEVLMRRRR